jgi:hypothetical protein
MAPQPKKVGTRAAAEKAVASGDALHRPPEVETDKSTYI